MKHKFFRSGIPVILGLMVCSLSLFAHHGNAAFDYTKKVSVSGTVTEWVWANPHSRLKLDVKDANGEIVHWIIEAANPQDLARQGWAHDSFKSGDQLSAMVIQAKNGVTVGRFVGGDNIILNGKPFPGNQ
jgi:hypothetical protein